MLLFFVVGTRKSLRHNEKYNDETGSLCFGQLKFRFSTFRSVHSKMAATFEAFLARPFPLEHKKLMFIFRIMIMLMILMPLVGTKLN